MYDLTHFSLKDMTACGAALRQMGSDAGSMEEVADRIVHYFYNSLVDSAGRCAGVLVRFFVTVPYRELPDDLRRQADRFLDPSVSTRTLKCQTLLATMGEKPEWRRRQDSRSYQAQPLTPEIVDVTPMLGPVSEMFGIALKQAIAPDPELLLDVEDDSYNIFHVLEAPGSPYVPAQKDFVVPYGIRSVLGFYGMLPSGNLFTVILFAKTPIARQVTEYFRPLALSVKMALLPFDGVRTFADDPEPAASQAQSFIHLRSQSASLRQLLAVQERVVVEQSERLARTVAELERQLAENARLREQAAQAAVAAERLRLARDLHDSVSQALYSQTLYAEAAIRQLAHQNIERTADHLQQIKEMAQQALREMRLLIFELRPSPLTENGLAAALRYRLETVESRAGIDASLDVHGDAPIPPEAETSLYWIAQEALNNALKHAQATQLRLRLWAEAARIGLRIEDDGIGFDPAGGPESNGFGLTGMQERCDQLGWRLQIHSAPGAGTTIHVEVPNG